MKFLNLVLVALVISGCATYEKIEGPDGTPHLLVRCTDVKDCYSKAREVCGGNYKIVNSSQSMGGSQVNAVTDINLLVKCDSE